MDERLGEYEAPAMTGTAEVSKRQGPIPPEWIDEMARRDDEAARDETEN